MPCLTTRNAGRAFGLLFAAASGEAALGCGGAAGTVADSRNEGLPAWEGPDRQTFDDDMEPPTTGLMGATGRSRKDPLVRDRARTADVVSRLRVNTVTAESVDGSTTFRIVVQIVSAPFIAPRISDTSWELVVGPSAKAHGITQAFETRLRGASFIGFLRRFAGEGGEPELHWHLSPDSAEVAAAVGDALGLAELSGQ